MRQYDMYKNPDNLSLQNFVENPQNIMNNQDIITQAKFEEEYNYRVSKNENYIFRESNILQNKNGKFLKVIYKDIFGNKICKEHPINENTRAKFSTFNFAVYLRDSQITI